jgi:DnaA-homolog protein
VDFFTLLKKLGDLPDSMAAMQQLLLDIRPAARPTLGNFIPGPNQELLDHLHRWLNGETPETALYIWGAPGSGKTHLLNALAALKPDMVVLDDIESLDAAAQIMAFDAFNQAKVAGKLWLAAGENAPAGLVMREDLRTRLGWGLIYRLQSLSDDDKQAALMRHAQDLGFDLEPAIAAWLLVHQTRDLGRLLQIVEALDRFSLQTKRKITLPLLKAVLPQAC